MSDALSDLKTRSGRSYEWLSKRTYISKSTMQRYCAGTGVPPTFAAVESIALACGASREEVARLFTLWTHERDEAGAGTGSNGEHDEPGQPDGAGEADGASGASTPNASGPGALETVGSVPEAPLPSAGVLPERPVRRVRRGTRLAIGAGAAAVLLSGLAVVTPLWRAGTAALGLTHHDTAGTQPTPGSSVVTSSVAPLWTRAATTVPSAFFGVTLNSATEATPDFRVGSLRLWDSSTRWAQFEPARGHFSWTTLDRHVKSAQRAGLPVLLTLGGTPRWANPDAPASVYPDGGRASPPLDLTDWDDAVRAVAQRYAGRIQAYELWPLGNDPRYFDGSIASLVEMTRRAARLLRSLDPETTIVCPGMGGLWTAEGQTALRRFALAGGYDECDVASIKLYQRQATDPPETMISLAAAVDRLLHESGVQPRIWVTGTTYEITLQKPVDPALARAYATRYYLTGLYARPLNVERMYYYNWGGSKLPLVLQAAGSPPTPAALAVDRLQQWLSGLRLTSCGHGQAAGLPAHAWACHFTRGAGDGPKAVTIAWTDAGTATIVAVAGDQSVQDLDGRVIAVRKGDAVPLAQEPVMIAEGS